MDSKWFFEGNIYYIEENKNLGEIFSSKIRKTGLSLEEIKLLVDGQSFNFRDNLIEVNDTVTTQGPSCLYINGFYYLSKKKTNEKEIQIILDGKFINACSL